MLDRRIVVHLMLLSMLAMLFACRAGPESVLPTTRAIDGPGMSLEDEYRIAYAEWKVEIEWSDFFSAFIESRSAWAKNPEVDALNEEDFLTIHRLILDVMMRPNFPMVSLMKMNGTLPVLPLRLGGASAKEKQKYMAEFVEVWRKRGPELRVARKKLCLSLVEKVWKLEKAAKMIRRVEREYPDVPLMPAAPKESANGGDAETSRVPSRTE